MALNNESILGIGRALSGFLPGTLSDGCCYDSHFVEEETEAQEGEIIWPRSAQLQSLHVIQNAARCREMFIGPFPQGQAQPPPSQTAIHLSFGGLTLWKWHSVEVLKY